jgi:4-amino-4-deoxy-L-arabinose transferase-like glycosyltransferase
VSSATRPAGEGAVTPGQVLAGLLLAALVLWLLVPFAGVDPPGRLTVSNAPWTDEGFNLAGARERVLAGRFATGDVDRSLTNGAYSALAAATFGVTGPSLAAGRALSMAAVAVAVLLLAVGLARPLGRPAALLAAVALGGANLVLEHGRLALVEAVVVALLVGAFVLATRAAWRPSLAAGAGVGLLVAAAVSVKANALLPGLVLLGVILVAAAARRDRRALAMGLAGLATLVLAGAAWLVAVALPNWERFRTALRIWPTVEYLGTPMAIAGRVGRYLADSDQALGRSLPLLLAAALGLAALARRWPGLDPAARDALVMAGLWGVGLWLAVAVGDYLPGHYTAPNRYVVPALPGLAVLAGFGLADLAGLAGRVVGGSAEREAGERGSGTRRAGWVAGVAGVVLGVAVALPGVAVYLDGAMASGRSREQGQRTLAATLPGDAVVFGAYAPTLLFDTRLTALTPWPTADANVRDPVGRFGVTHLLVGDLPADPTAQVAGLTARRARPRLARIPWGGGEVFLYGPPIGVGAEVSPAASPIDYDPAVDPSRQT